MNKLVKGAIAGASGFALLLGGAGTLASWNSSADIDAGSITAGALSIATPAPAIAWSLNGTTVNISAVRIVPGDVVSATQDINVKAVGDTLKVKPTLRVLVPGSLNSGADKALAGSIFSNHASATITNSANKAFSMWYDGSTSSFKMNDSVSIPAADLNGPLTIHVTLPFRAVPTTVKTE